MKSLMKFCLMLAAVFIVIGLIGVVAGMAMGAKPNQFLRPVYYRNNFSWHHDDIFDYWEDELDDQLDSWTEQLDDQMDSLDDKLDDQMDRLEDDLDEQLDSWEDDLDTWTDQLGNWSREETTSWTVDTFEGVYGNENTKKLELDLSKSVVKIYTHEDKNIYIKGSNAKNYFSIEEDGDTLRLRDTRKSKRKPLKLEIYLPERTFEKIEMDVGASKLYAQKLAAEKIDMDLGAGEFYTESLEGDKISINLGAGRLTIGGMAVQDRADLEVGAAEMVADNVQGGDLYLECGVGSIQMTAKGSEKDYNYSMVCGIGIINLNGTSHSGMGHDQTIDNQASKKVSMECGIGQIRLDFEQ